MKALSCSLLILVSCAASLNTVYYVKPDDSGPDRCEGTEWPCHTLEEYATNGTEYFDHTNEIILLFYEGHYVADRLNITSNSSISFVDATWNISTYSRCAVNIECDITVTLLPNEVPSTLVHFQGICLKGEVSIMAKKVSIDRSTFSSRDESGSEGTSPFTMIYSRCSDITINSSSFNVDMNITLDQCSTKNSVKVLNSVFNGTSNANRSLVSMVVIDTNIMISRCEFKDATGTGFRSHLNQSSLRISDSFISNNKNGGIYIATLSSGNDVIIESTNITYNSLENAYNGNPYRWEVPNGAGLSICPHEYSNMEKTYSILLRNVRVENNLDENSLPKIVFIYISHNATIIDSQFRNNDGSAVAVYLTNHFTIAGNTEFVDNTGVDSGALMMYTGYLTIADNSIVTFQGNNASNIGGGISVMDRSIQIDEGQQCFYQLQSTHPNVSLNFINNSAVKGGSHIYGATTKSLCSTSVDSHADIFNFDPDFNQSVSCVSSDPTRVCLCDENSNKQCAEMDYIFSARKCHPGENLTLSVIVVGADFGAVAGSVFARLSNDSNFLSDLQDSQQISNLECQNVNYTIHAEPGTNAQLVLTQDYWLSNNWFQNRHTAKEYVDRYKQHDVIDINLLNFPVYINITMEPCPAGLKLENKSCVCDSRLQIDEKVKCHIEGGVLHIMRSPTLWVSGNETVKFNTRCPKSKCKSEFMSLNMLTPDDQCQGKRSGVLCGECSEGHSLALGSLRCLSCPADNIHLLLIIPFAVAGILLVVFIKVLNLTVANGYINGLIFYCNVVWINKDILLPSIDNKETEFLRTFLAWFNLDLGIETCFFNGLDMYTYAWMQYLFPLYVLTLSFLLIIVGRKINLLGKSAPQVLATLILLSYYNLLNNVVLSLRVTTVTEIDSSGNTTSKAVWESDGSIDYMKDKHIILFIVAVMVLLILCMPYTLLLLLLRYLNQSKLYTVKSILLKLKPITDAYSGPFKPRKEYWVGILLLARVLLLIVSSGTYGTFSILNNVALIFITGGILFYKSQTGCIYRTQSLSLMENTLLFNLMLLAGISYLSVYGFDTAHSVVSSLLVALAFLQFLGLVVTRVALTIYEKFFQRPSTEITPLIKNLEEQSKNEMTDSTEMFMKWLDDEDRKLTSSHKSLDSKSESDDDAQSAIVNSY